MNLPACSVFFVQSQAPRIEDFQLTLSRLTTETFSSEQLRFGDKIKMQLVIQIPSVESVDFDVEVRIRNMITCTKYFASLTNRETV
jgi:hypothetical protein